MNATERAAIITLLCNVIAEHLETSELAQLATVLTQIGATLSFIAAQQALYEAPASNNNNTANGGTAASVTTENIEESLAENAE